MKIKNQKTKNFQVAVLINGHVRTLKYHINLLQKNCLDQIKNKKVYLQTWDYEDTPYATWWRGEKRRIKRTNIRYLKSKIRPDFLKIRNQKHEGKLFKTEQDRFHHFPTCGLYFSLKGTLDLLRIAAADKNNKRFIVIRPDLVFFTPLLQEELTDLNSLYFPRMDYFTLRGKICDVWYILSRNHLAAFEEYYEKIFALVLARQKKIVHHEDIFHDKILNSKNYCIKLSQVKWGLRRSANNVMQWPDEEKKYLGKLSKLYRIFKRLRKIDILNKIKNVFYKTGLQYYIPRFSIKRKKLKIYLKKKIEPSNFNKRKNI